MTDNDASVPGSGQPDRGPGGAGVPSSGPPDAGLTAGQQHWLDLGFGTFIHYGLATYHDVEWADGTYDPADLAPEYLDPAQWCAAAKAAGAKFVVLVAKHHDGFCMWPTATTDYSVLATPHRRDVLGETVEAARRIGLEVGLYYSLWDLHDPRFNDDLAYADVMTAQLAELLTSYGPMVEVWFDGMWAKMPPTWKTRWPAEVEEIWRDVGARRWDMERVYRTVKTLQPDTVVLNNSTTVYPGLALMPVDARTAEKGGADARPPRPGTAATLGQHLPVQSEYTISTTGPGEFGDGSWFWHAWDNTLRPLDEVVALREAARKSGSVLLMNLAPGPDGRLREEHVRYCQQLGAADA